MLRSGIALTLLALLLLPAGFLRAQPQSRLTSQWTGTFTGSIQDQGPIGIRFDFSGQFSVILYQNGSSWIAGFDVLFPGQFPAGNGTAQYTISYNSPNNGLCGHPTYTGKGSVSVDANFTSTGFGNFSVSVSLPPGPLGSGKTYPPGTYTTFCGVPIINSAGLDNFQLKDGATVTQTSPYFGGVRTLSATFHGGPLPSLTSTTSASSTITSTSTTGCQAFTMTPGLVGTAPTTGDTSVRLLLGWGGQVPTKATFAVSGAPGGMTTSFAFNPVNIAGASTGVLMDVTTQHVADGGYPLTVTATLIDPGTKQQCSTSAAVTIVVGNGLNAFSPVGKITQAHDTLIVNGTTGSKSVPTNGTIPRVGDILSTGKTRGVGAAIAARNGDVYFGNSTDATFLGLTTTANANGSKGLEIVPPASTSPQSPWSSCKTVNTCKITYQADSGEAKSIGLGPIGLALAVLEAGNPAGLVLFLIEGAVFVHHESELPERTDYPPINVYVTPSGAVILERGTQFEMQVDSKGTTLVTVFQGSVAVADAKGKYGISVVSAGQDGTARQFVKTADSEAFGGYINPNQVNQWWNQSLAANQSSSTLHGNASPSLTDQITGLFAGDNYLYLIIVALLVFAIVGSAYQVRSKRHRRRNLVTVTVQQRQDLKPEQRLATFESGEHGVHEPITPQAQQRAKFCGSCGGALDEGIKFCGKCGARV